MHPDALRALLDQQFVKWLLTLVAAPHRLIHLWTPIRRIDDNRLVAPLAQPLQPSAKPTEILNMSMTVSVPCHFIARPYAIT